jgi:hypothetical protein
MTKQFSINKISSKLYNHNSALKIKVQPFTFDTTGFLEKGKTPVAIFRFPIEKIYVVDATEGKIFENWLISLNEPQKKHFDLQFNERKISFGAFLGGNEYILFDRDNFIVLKAYKKDKVLKIELNDKFNTNLYDAVNFKWLEDENLDPAVARNESIQRLKNLWKTNSDNGSENGTINGKNITSTLGGTNWENDFANKNTKQDINQYESQLREKIFNVIKDKDIKIEFTVKEATETPASEHSSNNHITCKIQTDFFMSSIHKLEETRHNPKDSPFQEITFTFDKERAKSEVYQSLVDSEDETFELSFNTSKIDLEILVLGTLHPWRNNDKPKMRMVAERKALEVYFRHPDAFNTITIQKTGENPENDDTPKLNDLTNLLDAACSPSASEQDKIAALKKAGEFEGLINSENLDKITQINQQLTNKPAQLRQALSEKIENQLNSNNLTINDLQFQQDKTLYNDLKNNQQYTAHQSQIAEQRLTLIIGVTGAKKTLDNLETQIQAVLSSDNQEEKLRLQKLLKKFIKSKNIFYQDEKPRAQQLNRELKESIENNGFNQNSETPWEKIILFSCLGIGLLSLIILLVHNLNKNSRR